MRLEADGSVYPCDFFALDEYRVGSLAEATIEELYEKPMTAAFRSRPTEKPALCEYCPYQRICGGGCPRMRREVCGASEAKPCGYRAFLDASLTQMQLVAQRERKARME